MVCFVTFLVGCQSPGALSGAGYELLTPQPATARYIVESDRRFAEQVAAHNRQCRQDSACRR